jgi:hypothetical protein
MISEVGDDRCRHAERQDGVSIEHHYDIFPFELNNNLLPQIE